MAPHFQENTINGLIRDSFKFIWSGKPDRIKRKVATLPIKEGGLNMPDILNFWNSLKTSWARRLANSNAGWTKILETSLSNIHVDIGKVWFYGAKELLGIAQRLKNDFWKEAFTAFSQAMKDYAFSNPEHIMFQNIFGNYNFLREKTPLERGHFPNFSNKGILQIGDLFNISEKRFYSFEEFKLTYNINLDFLTFEGLKRTICQGLNRISAPSIDYSDCYKPRLPVLLHMFGNSKKGCGSIYKILQAKNKINATKPSEEIWNRCLGTFLSLKFWGKIWKLPTEANLDNKIKFLQLQINLHVLPTNYSVSKYNPMTSPYCTFCSNELERIEHLFFDCVSVQNLLSTIKPFLDHHQIGIIFNRRYCLFGSNNSNGDSCENMILVFTRAFIWRQKAIGSNLNFDTWKGFIQNKLELEKLCIYSSANDIKINEFDLKWATLLEEL